MRAFVIFYLLIASAIATAQVPVAQPLEAEAPPVHRSEVESEAESVQPSAQTQPSPASPETSATTVTTVPAPPTPVLMPARPVTTAPVATATAAPVREPVVFDLPVSLVSAKATDRITGLGPSASKIYFTTSQGYALGLSSEVFTYSHINGDDASTGNANINRTNVLSLAPSLGLRLHPRLVFNTQLLFENGGAEASNTVTLQKGQSIVRTAYVDWLAASDLRAGIRVGHQLIPLGTVNTSADPTTYFGVLRPDLERELIPSSWHENGVVAWVDRDRAELQAGIFNSLDASSFRGDSFISGGRGQGQNSAAEDVMGVFRINAKRETFSVGVSSVFGNSAQGSSAIRSGAFQLGEAHVQLHLPRLQLLAMVAHGELQDADSISILNSSVVAEQAQGYYAQGAVEVLNQNQKLWLFARYTAYNLQYRVPETLTADPATNKTITSFGLSYLPIPGFVVKADYNSRRSGAGNDADDFNLGLGFVF